MNIIRRVTRAIIAIGLLAASAGVLAQAQESQEPVAVERFPNFPEAQLAEVLPPDKVQGVRESGLILGVPGMPQTDQEHADRRTRVRILFEHDAVGWCEWLERTEALANDLIRKEQAGESTDPDYLRWLGTLRSNAQVRREACAALLQPDRGDEGGK